MKIRILESAKQDLREGFHFYESQETGIGSYFWNPYFLISSRFACLLEYIAYIFGGTTVFFPSGFPSQSIIVSRRMRQGSTLFWTAEEILHG
jgi:hypothetical protein